jgi:predicted DNA-binding antitoxin AbrB/MazE fold protein
MKIKATLEEKYVPKWNRNRELPEGERVVVEIKWPTTAQRESLKGYKISPKDEDVKVVFDTARILRDHVVSVANLEVEFNGKPVLIKTGVDLADTKALVLSGLIDELKAYITSEDGLEDETEKN